MPRLRANHLQRFIDYYLLLQYDFPREVDALTQAITNNESYFFREVSQFEAIQGQVLKSLIDDGIRPGNLRILSAGCSSGEEPYTLNIFLRQQPAISGSNLSIDGIDLDTERLEQARSATYRPGSLRTLDKAQIDRYFAQHDETSFELRLPFRSGVKFSRGNILEPIDLSAAALRRAFLPQRPDLLLGVGAQAGDRKLRLRRCGRAACFSSAIPSRSSASPRISRRSAWATASPTAGRAIEPCPKTTACGSWWWTTRCSSARRSRGCSRTTRRSTWWARPARARSCLTHFEAWQPDVVTLDLEMPGMGGLATLGRMTALRPTPVIILSTHSGKGAPRTIEALHRGATDFIDKQQYSLVDFGALRHVLLEKILQVTGRAPGLGPEVDFLDADLTAAWAAAPSAMRTPSAYDLVVVGASTGGPPALQLILEELGPTVPVPVVVVQHMPKGFTHAFAERLNAHLPLQVREVQHNETLVPDTVYIAVAGTHLRMRRRDNDLVAELSPFPKNSVHTPSVDVLFESAARSGGRRVIGVLLTGMGSDGAKGMAALKAMGAYTLCQDENSCVVFGMPRAALALGAVSEVAAPPPDRPAPARAAGGGAGSPRLKTSERAPAMPAERRDRGSHQQPAREPAGSLGARGCGRSRCRPSRARWWWCRARACGAG